MKVQTGKNASNFEALLWGGEGAVWDVQNRLGVTVNGFLDAIFALCPAMSMCTRTGHELCPRYTSRIPGLACICTTPVSHIPCTRFYPESHLCSCPGGQTPCRPMWPWQCLKTAEPHSHVCSNRVPVHSHMYTATGSWFSHTCMQQQGPGSADMHTQNGVFQHDKSDKKCDMAADGAACRHVT